MPQLDRYIIEEELGEGTYVRVYRAVDQKLRRRVALKVLKPAWLNDPSAMRRFQKEATSMANLHHPNIVPIFDVGEAEGTVFLSQFLVEGESLADRLARGPLRWAQTLEILRGVAAALDYAHAQDLIHRDIKPSNILLSSDDVPYLCDFGLLRAAEGSASVEASSGGLIGTPAYMAPEQWQGQDPTPATDVYALACVVGHMLTGVPLFDAPTPPAIMMKHVLEGPSFPDEWPPDAPAGLSDVLQRGLAQDPAERLQSAGELLAALSIASRPTSHAPRSPKPSPPAPDDLPDTLTITTPFTMEFIRIPAGEFLMGSDPAKDKDAKENEQPQHTVTLPDYYIAKYPVTNAQFAAFLRATGHDAHGKWQGGKKFPHGDTNHPAIDVSWHEAVAFCRWLAKESGYAIRLPTEAEWEKAARGTEGRIYPWGDDWDDSRLNSSKVMRSWGTLIGMAPGTTPVGQHSPQGDSSYGLADMAGNVREWCSTITEKSCPFQTQVEWIEDYLSRGGVFYVVRGGGWDDNMLTARCAYRNLRKYSVGGSHSGGFRVMVAPISQASAL